MYGHDNPAAFAPVLQLAGMTWMGMLLLIAISLFAVDLVTGFGFFLPRLAPSLRGAALICGLVLSLIAMAQGTRAPVVRNQDVELSGLPANLDGMVIVGLSDLHIGATLDGKWLEQRIAQVLAERPDMVVLLGDIFEGHGEPSNELTAGLKGLTAPMGVWAVLGNHEFHGRENGIVQIFRNAGIIVLRNERTTIRAGLILAGVDDLTSNYRSGLKSDLVTKSLVSPPMGATILLSHTPWNADRAAKAGAGLMLCGHTHGGQIWPFGYLVRLFYPLLEGRYDVDGMTVIVSRGAGTWGPRMRLWQPGEIIRITLKAKKKEA
jgi:predicted MPP superfamily phosphohydrolase